MRSKVKIVSISAKDAEEKRCRVCGDEYDTAKSDYASDNTSHKGRPVLVVHGRLVLAERDSSQEPGYLVLHV